MPLQLISPSQQLQQQQNNIVNNNYKVVYNSDKSISYDDEQQNGM